MLVNLGCPSSLAATLLMESVVIQSSHQVVCGLCCRIWWRCFLISWCSQEGLHHAYKIIWVLTNAPSSCSFISFFFCIVRRFFVISCQFWGWDNYKSNYTSTVSGTAPATVCSVAIVRANVLKKRSFSIFLFCHLNKTIFYALRSWNNFSDTEESNPHNQHFMFMWLVVSPLWPFVCHGISDDIFIGCPQKLHSWFWLYWERIANFLFHVQTSPSKIMKISI